MVKMFIKIISRRELANFLEFVIRNYSTNSFPSQYQLVHCSNEVMVVKNQFTKSMPRNPKHTSAYCRVHHTERVSYAIPDLNYRYPKSEERFIAKPK